MTVHELHLYLSHEIDLQNLKALLRKGNNAIQL